MLGVGAMTLVVMSYFIYSECVINLRGYNSTLSVFHRIQDAAWSQKSLGGSGILTRIDDPYRNPRVIAPACYHLDNLIEVLFVAVIEPNGYSFVGDCAIYLNILYFIPTYFFSGWIPKAMLDF